MDFKMFRSLDVKRKFMII